MRKNLLTALGFTGIGVLLLCFVNWNLSQWPIPNYASWTGNLQLERKLELYRTFAKEGPVDALILGSSVANAGISAEILSEKLSSAYEKKFRVFNFAISAGSILSYPTFYKLVRSISVPKNIYLVSGWNGGNVIPALKKAPIGKFLDHPRLLIFSMHFWSIPIVKHAAAVGDYLINRSYFLRSPDYNVDYHSVTAYGDTRFRLIESGSVNPKKQESEKANFITYASNLVLKKGGKEALPFEESEGMFDSPSTLKELKALAEQDHTPILLISYDNPTLMGLKHPPDSYLLARRTYHNYLARRLDAKKIFILDQYRMNAFELLDQQHQNFEGSKRFTFNVAQAILQQPLLRNDWKSPDLTVIFKHSLESCQNECFVVTRESPQQGSTLQLRLINNPILSMLLPHPGSTILVGLTPLGGQEMVASFSRSNIDNGIAHFPNLPSEKNQVFFVRLLQPAANKKEKVSSFRWFLNDYNWI